MKDIAIYGAGGFGREVACLIKLINESGDEPMWNLIGFFDDGKEKGTRNEYGEILGGMEEVNDWAQPLSVVLAIATPRILKRLSMGIVNENIQFPNICAPDLFYADKSSVTLGKGNIIQRNCSFSCNVRIGDFNILNGADVFGHDVQVGSFNTFMTAVRISGEVEIGEQNFLGVNSCVLQQLKVCNGVTLGAGSVLMTKPKNGSSYIGVPAKIFRY